MENRFEGGTNNNAKRMQTISDVVKNRARIMSSRKSELGALYRDSENRGMSGYLRTCDREKLKTEYERLRALLQTRGDKDQERFFEINKQNNRIEKLLRTASDTAFRNIQRPVPIQPAAKHTNNEDSFTNTCWSKFIGRHDSDMDSNDPVSPEIYGNQTGSSPVFGHDVSGSYAALFRTDGSAGYILPEKKSAADDTILDPGLRRWCKKLVNTNTDCDEPDKNINSKPEYKNNGRSKAFKNRKIDKSLNHFYCGSRQVSRKTVLCSNIIREKLPPIENKYKETDKYPKK